MIAILGICAAVFAVYASLVDHPFHTFDDPIYVTNNYYVQQGLTWRGTVWAFESLEGANWHPLAWLSHMADIQLFGAKPAGHYFSQIILHIADAALLFWLFRLLIKNVWISFLLAVVWALHPSNVECVAWISQRKTLVSSFFMFAGFISFCKYRETQNRSYYWLSILSQLIASLAKPVAVLFPVSIVLIDVLLVGAAMQHRVESVLRIRPIKDALLALSRLSWDFFAGKLPFIAIAGYLSLVTFYAQDSAGATGFTYVHSFGRRCANAAESIVDYTVKAFTMPETSILYIMKPLDVSKVCVGLALVVAAALCVAAFIRKHRIVSVGVAWYLLMFLPTIGLVQVGSQRLADRYLHLPIIGLIGVVFYIALVVPRSVWAKRMAIWLLCGWAVALGLQTRSIVYEWSDALRLSVTAMKVGGPSHSMMINCSVAAMEKGWPEVSRKFLLSIQDDKGGICNMAVVDLREKKYKAAIARSHALDDNPQYKMRAATIRGEALAALGQYEEAAAEIHSAIQSLPPPTSYLLSIEQLRLTLPVMEDQLRRKAQLVAAEKQESAKEADAASKPASP